ncbi:MAG: aminopeptidase [Chlamydiia bacterium]|nr:aminopeptidase [Chlamydiia bacterium]
MRDPRLNRMAAVIVHYSLEIKPKDLVWMVGEMGALPLMEAIYEQVIRAGGNIKTDFHPPGWDEIFFRYANEDQLKHGCPFSLYNATHCDKRIRIIGSTNTRSLAGVDPIKQALVSQANQVILKQQLQRSAKGELDWIVSLCPTPAGAQEADMGTLDYAHFVYNAAYVDQEDPVSFLKQMEKKQQKMIDYLSTKKELHFQTKYGTDLRVNVSGMKWINSCGKRNYPDGEVFTGPNLDAEDGGVNGVIKYTFPAIWHNTIVEEVELTFTRGVVTRATASKNETFLRAMLDQDEGAKRLGEIAIGTNFNIQRFTSNILFDEKIGGTFHAALGMGYPETGNTNQSALHWDMICDLKESGGEITADGEVIMKDGRFIFLGWPGVE